MAGVIQFPRKAGKIVETILYIAHKGDFTRYQIVKFFYLADREHLRKYGRPITFDHYVAMEAGPVASIAYDLIKGRSVQGVKITDLPFELTLVRGKKGVANPRREVRLEMFSRSDTKVLDAVVEKFGSWSFDQLFKHTHGHEAYGKAWRRRATDADAMAFDDFFENMENRESIVEELAFSARGM